MYTPNLMDSTASTKKSSRLILNCLHHPYMARPWSFFATEESLARVVCKARTRRMQRALPGVALSIFHLREQRGTFFRFFIGFPAKTLSQLRLFFLFSFPFYRFPFQFPFAFRSPKSKSIEGFEKKEKKIIQIGRYAFLFPFWYVIYLIFSNQFVHSL